MDLDGFLRAVGDFPLSQVANSYDALAVLRYGEAARALDQIAPELLQLYHRPRAPWFTKEQRAMKPLGQCLEQQ